MKKNPTNSNHETKGRLTFKYQTMGQRKNVVKKLGVFIR